MRKVELREWDDLDEEEQRESRVKMIDSLCQCEIDALFMSVDDGDMTEEEAYAEIGCSKFYAESTPWFVSSCYYDSHRAQIDARADELLREKVYDFNGHYIVT